MAASEASDDGELDGGVGYISRLEVENFKCARAAGAHSRGRGRPAQRAKGRFCRRALQAERCCDAAAQLLRRRACALARVRRTRSVAMRTRGGALALSFSAASSS
jgi:hypothetical protein